MRKIILASASPRRSELLQRAGVVFEVLPSDWEERITAEKPSDAVQELSRGKALFVAEGLEQAAEGTLVIGSDTIVVYEGEILGKPTDKEDAVQTLLRLQGNTHQVYTGVTVLERKDGKWLSHVFYESTDVTFYPVSETEIRAYADTKEPMDKAGSYGIQGLWGIYVKGICGDYNNVVGLPVARLFHEMKNCGIELRG